MNTFEGKKVLVTGGLGFIGSNLSRRLTELGADVTVFDNCDPEGGANPFNVRDIEQSITIIPGDIRDKLAMKWAVVGKEYIFNLAGQTSHRESMAHPYKDLETNACAQLSLMELCRKYNPGVKIVFTSTRQVYGRPEYLPVDERHPVYPVDVNGVNKWSGEQYHLLYNNVYGIKSTVLRLTNTYGQGMRIRDANQMFLGIWIRLVLEGKPFEVWEGHHLRDFNHVDDVVDALVLAADRYKSNGQVFNLGAPERVPLKTIADMLVGTYGGSYIEKNLPGDRKAIDIGNYYSNYSKIQQVLGWKPKVTLYDGLIKTVDYYNKNFREYV